MKKIITFIVMVIFSINGYSKVPPISKQKNKIKSKIISKSITKTNEKDFCTIGCSATVGGVTYTASAGNWFTGCETAGSNCLLKLNKSINAAIN